MDFDDIRYRPLPNVRTRHRSNHHRSRLQVATKRQNNDLHQTPILSQPSRRPPIDDRPKHKTHPFIEQPNPRTTQTHTKHPAPFFRFSHSVHVCRPIFRLCPRDPNPPKFRMYSRPTQPKQLSRPFFPTHQVAEQRGETCTDQGLLRGVQDNRFRNVL